MYILNLEDNVFKHHDICRAIERGSFENLKIDCVGNLADGLSKIEEAINQEKPYILIKKKFFTGGLLWEKERTL